MRHPTHMLLTLEKALVDSRRSKFYVQDYLAQRPTLSIKEPYSVALRAVKSS
jgi:hypothetical protein